MRLQGAIDDLLFLFGDGEGFGVGVGDVEGEEGEAEVVFEVFVFQGAVLSHPEAAGEAQAAGDGFFEGDDAGVAGYFVAEGFLRDVAEPAVAFGVAADVPGGDFFCGG